jgi:hypothetical protein
MPGEIGSLEWTRRTNGLLNRGERARYIAAAMRAQALAGPRLLALRAGVRARRRASIREEEMRVPDSALARSAAEECARTHPRTIFEHNLRSFLYARALGSLGGFAPDEEVLFVATMFHDAGVMDIDRTDDGRCFTLRGADAAVEHMQRGGAAADRCDAAAGAITLHINPAVGPESGVEAHLMHDGVLLDAVGLRAWDIEADAIERVRAAHPRLRFSQEARSLLAAQGKAIPKCRIAAAFNAGFGLAVRIGPWQD